MSDGFTIGAALGAPTIFQCPNCNETIDSSAASCRFCGAKVDPEAAMLAAEALAKINQACSDSTYLRSTALAIPVFFVLRYVPFFGWVGTVGFIGLCIGVPVWAMRWWSKFARIATPDAEFRSARNTVKFVGISVSAVFVVVIVLPFVVGFLLARAR